MPSKNQEIQDFFILIQQGIKKHGVKKIARTIQIIDIQKNNMFFHEIFNFIIDNVCKEYKVEEIDLFEKKKRGDATLARKLAILIAKNHLDISDEQLAFQFGRSRQIVHNFRLEFLQDQREKTHDKNFISKYYKVDKKVVKYIEKLKGE